jgi:two-component sensor histidine kinase
MKANILIVDDMPDNLRLLDEMLAEQGFTVRAALNGPRALSTVQITPPDLILLDIKMPEMDGFEVCERLKADERTRDIPVIFISALQDVADKVKGFSLGAVDYITKPFQAEEVLARVHTHLALRNLQVHLEELVEERTTELRAALEHKTALLREVHHRTRNNMQVMSVLLGLHAQSIDDESTQQFLKGLQARIDSMSLVHQKLHRSDLMRINLKEYIKDLARTMQVNYRVSSGRITFTFDTEAVLMTIDSAVPFGLLLNELLSNALKHAFPDDRKGEIHITLHTIDEGKRELRVCDNGVGLPENFDLNKANTLGLQLIKILIRQLRGTVEFQRKDPGTELIIRFKEPYYEKRI